MNTTPMPELPQLARRRLPDLVGDLRQLASVQRVTIEDGPDRGQPLVQLTTGAGLDFSVKEAGSLDIASLRFRGMPIGWRHPAGDADNTERALTGFLVTCGLENVRAPRKGLRQHGSLPLSATRITAIGENWDAITPHLFVEGEIIQPFPNKATLRLTRRITAPIGGTALTIEDTVDNISAIPAEMMVLYHFNFGFPVIADGCKVQIADRSILQITKPDFEDRPQNPQCHRLGAENKVSLLRPFCGAWPGLKMTMDISTDSLPFFQTWRDARRGRNILALEPSNCGNLPDNTSDTGTLLAPSDRWSSAITLTFN